MSNEDETDKPGQLCMFCSKGGRRTFNIFEDWNGRHTISEDLTEVFGNDIVQHLRQSDVLCNLCMNIMENFAKLKRRLKPKIVDREFYEAKPIKFGKLWDMFASAHIDEEHDTLMSCPTPSPTLVRCSRSKPYLADREKEIEEREHARSLSRASSYYFSDSSLNREVSQLFSKRKQRKKRGKKRQWTHRKTRSRTRSTVSSTSTFSSRNYSISPTESNDSDCSYQSFYRPQSRNDSRSSNKSSTITILKYHEGKLINKRTRSVSRAQEVEAQAVAEKEQAVLSCDHENCDRMFRDLDMYTAHKIVEHKDAAFYVCNVGCRRQYVSMADLELHQKQVHDQEPLGCSMCGVGIRGATALQKHIKEHLAYSVGCIYCDKYFLNKKSRDDHIRQYHRGKKKRMKYNFQGIIDRVDKSDSEGEMSESENHSPVPFEEKEFYIKFLNIAKDLDGESTNSDVSSVHRTSAEITPAPSLHVNDEIMQNEFNEPSHAHMDNIVENINSAEIGSETMCEESEELNISVNLNSEKDSQEGFNIESEDLSNEKGSKEDFNNHSEDLNNEKGGQEGFNNESEDLNNEKDSQEGFNNESEDLNSEGECLNQDSGDLSSQGKCLNQHSGDLEKQNEDINIQNEDINIQNEDINIQNEELKETEDLRKGSEHLSSVNENSKPVGNNVMLIENCYITLDNLRRDDVLFTKIPKIILIDYLKTI